ncbi:Yih1 protein [Saccharomycopsis crataegensis]|uniref:Yih1 protein n=1 Tax=Saccharomycopsis crataegensis TaxID=43959 RepID=A0AAV5QEJ0_9ASCO|nr:Yih1 protein [Saccharomycopsis crataegensis]
MSSPDFLDELEAIEAIYPDCLTRLTSAIMELIIPSHPWCKIRLSFSDSYPESSAPNILLVKSTRKVDRNNEKPLETLVQSTLDEIFVEGLVCLFDLFTFLDEKLTMFEEQSPEMEVENEETPDLDDYDDEISSVWAQSVPVTDRGSTFIGFACTVHSDDQVNEYLAQLRSNRKIARSRHSMCAWRIKNQDGTIIQDSDDDGETAAGGRMLHLMTLMDVWNCLVVDVRWFGGVHIGPDRFKHINSTSREAIINGGFAPLDKPKKK